MTVQQQSDRGPQFDDDYNDERVSNTLALFAKLLCSGTFVVGRDPAEFLEHDLKTHVRREGMPVGWDEIDIDIDRVAGTVTMSASGISRTAKYNQGQGCTIFPANERRLHFTPIPVTSALPDARSISWPMGDLLSDVSLPEEVDRQALESTLDLAFDDSQHQVPQRTRGMVVLYKDQIVAERYAPGFGKNTRQVSWSMGKSITAALVGILVGQGHISLDDPAPIAEWQGTEKEAIRIKDLLRMSSGLGFSRAQDDDKLELGWTNRDDHMYIYYGAVDVFEHSITRPLKRPPNTFWTYRNCDPLTLGKIVRQTVEAQGEDYLTFPQRALFDRIGARNYVLEPDPWGNFIMTGFDYGTPRDWARFGLLHLHDGVWQGERILPEGWVDFIRTPAPAAEEKQYGGQFWLNAGNRYPDIPSDAFWPMGAWGQVAFIIPSKEMVVIRLGHSPEWGGESYFDTYINQTVGDIVRAVG